MTDQKTGKKWEGKAVTTDAVFIFMEIEYAFSNYFFLESLQSHTNHTLHTVVSTQVHNL